MIPEFVINVFDQVTNETFQASTAFRVRVALLEKMKAFAEALPLGYCPEAKDLEAIVRAPTIRIDMVLSDEDVEQLAQRIANCFAVIFRVTGEAGSSILHRQLFQI